MKKFTSTVFTLILAACLIISTATTVIAANAPPIADAGGPYTGDEGSPIALDGSGSVDPEAAILLYEWDLDYDGDYDDATGVTPDVTFDDLGAYTISLKVTDDFGQADTDDANVIVNNVAPTVGPIIAPTVLIGMSTNASADFTDPGTADTHTAVWDWGDLTTTPGTVTQGAGSGSVANSHTYSAAGTYTIELTVTDDDGGSGTFSGNGTVVLVVDIDIKPLSDPNSINLKSKGVIPVAILGTASFDATTVDGTTVMFAGASPAHDHSDPLVVANHLQDVDGDGYIDYIFHFKVQDTNISSGNPSAMLTGSTLGIQVPISGTDSIRTRH
jgi:PKD repeat protein